MKIRIHPSFIVYIAIVSVFASLETAISAFMALVVHETSHYIASKWFGECIAVLDVTPFGGVMTYVSGKSPRKGIQGCVVAAAGPLGNYGMILLLSQPFMQNWIQAEVLKQAIIINLGMMLLNLLPALPLDGGRIAFCAGYYLFSISSITTALSLTGIAVGCALIGFGLYGAWALNCINVSLLMIGGYLIVYARKSRFVILTENLYVLLQEKQQREETPIRAYILFIKPETTLKDALLAVGKAPKVLFYTNDALLSYWIEDTEIISEFLQTPDSDIHSLIEKRLKKARTSAKIHSIP